MKFSSGRTRFRRAGAAVGIAGLVLAGIAGPALATGEDDGNDPTLSDSPTESGDPSGDVDGEAGPGDGSDSDDGEGSLDGDDVAEDDGAGDDTEGDGPAEEDGEELELAPLSLNEDGTELTVDLVGINDFHGRIDAGRDLAKGDEGAGVKLAAAVEARRAANPDTLFVGAGDLYSASTFTSMAGDDIPTTDVFNAIGMDTSAVGNHEFDHGYQNLLDRIDGEGDYAGHAIAWEYLGANVYEKGTTSAALPEYFVAPVGGVDIAFIGLVTQETPSLVTPAGIAGLDFGDPTAAVERVADYEDVRNADAIVVLTHDGGVNGEAVTDTSTHFGAFVADMAERGDIAGIFSGHTHTMYEVPVDLPTTITDVGTMPVIQTGSFGENLGLISLTFDIDDEGNATFTGATSGMTALSTITPPAEGDNVVVDEVREIVEKAVAEAAEVGGEVIGVAGADLLRATHTDPVTGNPGENRGGESTISNLIADAQLWAVHEQAATDNLPVIAFMNPGGVRTDIPAGEVTYKQVADVQPFANTLETLDLTGAQIKSVLEEQWQPDGSSRPFLKLGVNQELFYTYDPEAPRGERVLEILLDGMEIDPASTYRVVTNNFLASGGDNFFTLGEGANQSDTGLVDLAAFVDYFKAHEVVDPDYRQRAIGVHWVTDEDATHAPGDEVEIHVSSLVFSNDEDKPTSLTATLWGTNFKIIPAGDFEIDPAIVNTNDESGRAVVKFAIPSAEVLGGEAGWSLELYDAVNDHSLWFPIAITVPTDGGPGDGDGDDKTPGAGDKTPGDKKPGTMPDTGTDVNAMVIAAGLLLLVGATTLGVRRKLGAHKI